MSLKGKRLSQYVDCVLRAVSQHAAAAQERSRKQRQTEETRKHS